MFRVQRRAIRNRMMTGLKARCRQLIYPLVMWIAQLFSVTVFVQYLWEIYQLNSNDWVHIGHAVAKFYLFANFLIVTLTDPGIVPRNRWPNTSIKWRQLIEVPPPIKIAIAGTEVALNWCNACQFHGPPTSVHCYTCNFCIEEFDHHCVWLNHCIGRRNYRFFFAFIVLQTIDLIFSITVCAWGGMDSQESSVYVLSMVSIGILVLLTLPVLSLTVFHAIILFKGQTTHDFVSDAEVKLTRHWLHVLFGALYPSLVNRR